MSLVDEVGRCVSQKHVFSSILQNLPDEFSDEFCDELQTHRGQKAEVSRECPELAVGHSNSYAPSSYHNPTMQLVDLVVSRRSWQPPKDPKVLPCMKRRRLNSPEVASLAPEQMLLAITVCVQSHQATIHTSQTKKTFDCTANTRTCTDTHEHHNHQRIITVQRDVDVHVWPPRSHHVFPHCSPRLGQLQSSSRLC